MTIYSLLDSGVDKGIISADQRTALLALAGAAEPQGGERREAERAFNGVTIAYGIGAIVVLFAFGWFMVDRWKVLGNGGVFGLSVAYAGIFLVVAHFLKREGFETARGVATLLAVAMAPLAMYALLGWTGLWTPELEGMCRQREHPFAVCQGQPLAIELAAVAAALVAMRAMAFAPLMIPIAVVGITLPERLLREWAQGTGLDGLGMGWRWVIIASLLAAVAYTVDRRRRDEDYGFWLWISVAVAAWFGCFMVFQADHSLRWYLAPVSLLVITASVLLRRRVLLVVGLFGVFGFLAWMAFDVFKLTTAFPLVLATIGVSIIVLTVWVQKRFPEAIQRMGGDPSKPARFPGGVVAMLAPALLGLMLMPDAARLDREKAADRRSANRARSAHHRIQRDSIDAANRGQRPGSADTISGISIGASPKASPKAPPK
ncbi:MAG: hypothetical protein Q8K55_10065 [Gemmatimonadaceae bacterium]|nr:hypothetical protein [Gemmatimonadaceae bacterium]